MRFFEIYFIVFFVYFINSKIELDCFEFCCKIQIINFYCIENKEINEILFIRNIECYDFGYYYVGYFLYMYFIILVFIFWY